MDLEQAAADASVLFGRRLREWRQHLGLSQRAVAALAGVSVNQISILESAQRPVDPKLSTLVRLASAVGQRMIMLPPVRPPAPSGTR